MKRLLIWIVFLGLAAGAFWWQRAAAVPYLAKNLPFTKPWLAEVPAFAPLLEAGSGAAENAGQQRGGRRGAGGPVAVVTAKAETKNLPVLIEAIGTAQAAASIAIRTRLDNAQVKTIDVSEGARVEAGQKLFTLDDSTIKAQLEQTDAMIAKDKAQIEQNQADLDRANDLLARRAGSAVARDTAATALKIAQAQLASDTAARTSIATTLGWTVISTPVPGRVGSIPVKVGSIVRLSDSAPLATVNQVDPAIVVFALPQARLGEVREAMAQGPVEVRATNGRHTLSGTIAFVENAIDTTTGTVTVKASIPNADEHLWPGAFVQVEVVLRGPGPAVVVPSAAVLLGQEGPFVFVIKDGKAAELRKIVQTRVAGADTIISAGVDAGEDVAVEGQQRLVNGAQVAVKQAVAAADAKD